MNTECKFNEETIEDKDFKMFVGGFDPLVTRDDLLTYFQQFGLVSNVKVVGEAQNKPRGFGFVHFTSQKVLEEVCKMKHMFQGREVDCMMAKSETKGDSKSEPSDTEKEEDLRKTAFIQTIPLELKKRDLQVYFQKFGIVEKVLIMIRNKKRTSFGYIKFEEREVALQVIGREHQVKPGYVLFCEQPLPKKFQHKSPNENELDISAQSYNQYEVQHLHHQNNKSESYYGEMNGGRTRIIDNHWLSRRGINHEGNLVNRQAKNKRRDKEDNSDPLIREHKFKIIRKKSNSEDQNQGRLDREYPQSSEEFMLYPGYYPAPVHLLTEFPYGIPPELIYDPEFVYTILFPTNSPAISRKTFSELVSKFKVKLNYEFEIQTNNCQPTSKPQPFQYQANIPYLTPKQVNAKFSQVNQNHNQIRKENQGQFQSSPFNQNDKKFRNQSIKENEKRNLTGKFNKKQTFNQKGSFSQRTPNFLHEGRQNSSYYFQPQTESEKCFIPQWDCSHNNLLNKGRSGYRMNINHSYHKAENQKMRNYNYFNDQDYQKQTTSCSYEN